MTSSDFIEDHTIYQSPAVPGGLRGPMLGTHRPAKSLEIDDTPNHRRIVIDGEMFPYYTNGDIEVRPMLEGHQNAGSIVLIPVWVDGPVTRNSRPLPRVEDDAQ